MADMKAAANKAWETRRTRYGENGLKPTQEPEKSNCKKGEKTDGKEHVKPAEVKVNQEHP